MQSNNGNFEKYKSEMLRMYQQKNRPVNSAENNYEKNNENNFYNNTVSNSSSNKIDDETDYFFQKISDNIKFGDDFPPVSYRQDISPHTVRGDKPIEYDSQGNRTSSLIFDESKQNEVKLGTGERRLIDKVNEREFNEPILFKNINGLQGSSLNLENKIQINSESSDMDKNMTIKEGKENIFNVNDNIDPSGNVKKKEDWMNFEARNTSNGFLKVQVYSAQGAFPLKDARVIISKNMDNQQKIFYDMITDESGITQPVSLPAPDASHSFVIDGVRPYENYNIEVSKQGFQTTLREGLPIFPGVVSLQPIQLRPMLASEQDNNV